MVADTHPLVTIWVGFLFEVEVSDTGAFRKLSTQVPIDGSERFNIDRDSRSNRCCGYCG